MFAIQVQQSTITDTVEIRDPTLSERLTLACAYYSSYDGSVSFSGLEVKDRAVAEATHIVDVESLLVANIRIQTSTWKEMHRWIGWTIGSDTFLLWKDITNIELFQSKLGEFFNLDIKTVNQDGRSRHIEIEVDLIECNAIENMVPLLQPIDLEILEIPLR